MTFFANAGIRFPDLDSLTRDAGQTAMDAGSGIWKILAAVEGRKEDIAAEDANLAGERSLCVSRLRQAASEYQKVAGSMKEGVYEHLSPADRDLAGIDFEYWRYEDPRRRGESVIYLPSAYHELARRLLYLATQMESLQLNGNRLTMAPTVFQVMRQWEVIARSARAIAVVNGRQASR